MSKHIFENANKKIEEVNADLVKERIKEIASNDSISLYERAREIVLIGENTTISFLQRHLKVNYPTCADLIKELEMNSVVSEPNLRGLRTIIVENNKMSA